MSWRQLLRRGQERVQQNLPIRLIRGLGEIRVFASQRKKSRRNALVPSVGVVPGETSSLFCAQGE